MNVKERPTQARFSLARASVLGILARRARSIIFLSKASLSLMPEPVLNAREARSRGKRREERRRVNKYLRCPPPRRIDIKDAKRPTNIHPHS